MNGVSAHDVVMDGGWGDVWLWWLEHGLDGIAGGIIAVLGVTATLWWDRRARKATHRRDDLQALRRQVIAAQDRSLRLRLKTKGREPWTRKTGVEWYGELISLANELRSHAVGVAPSLDEVVTDFLDRVIEARPETGLPDPEQLVPMLIYLEAVLQGWLLSPDRFAEVMPELEWPGLAEANKVTWPPPGEPESALVAFARRIGLRRGRGRLGD